MFWLIMVFIGGGMDLLSAPSTANLLNLATFVAAGLISITVHEYGHALMMKKYGRHPHIVLHGLGGAAMSQGAPFSKKQDLLVTFMGPLAQIALGAIALVIYFWVGPDNFPAGRSELFVSFLAKISIFWAVINLIPIHPLDGGQIFSALVGPRNQKIVYITGIVLAATLGIYCLTAGLFFGMIILGLLVIDNVKALQGVGR